MTSLNVSALRLRRSLLAATFTGVVVLAGCGLGTQLPSDAASASTVGYTMTGRVQVGAPNGSAGVHPNAALPVAGATVTLYSAGVSGYGSAAVALAKTTTASDGSGSFAFVQNAAFSSTGSTTNQYACPVYTFRSTDNSASITRDSMLYIIVSGGNTGAGVNNAAVYMGLVGGCAAFQAHPVNLVIDAVTTAASVFSLAPYISPVYTTNPGSLLGTSTTYQAQYSTAANPTGGLGASTVAVPMGYTGLVNAFASAGKLADAPSGAARSAYAVTANGVTMTATPETAKLNHIADILSYCTDSPGTAGNCATLFSYTAPPVNSSTTSLGAGVTFPVATDTFQAAYYMAVNPTDFATSSTISAPNAVFTTAGVPITTTNIYKLFNLVSGTSDYQPTLTAQPSDWTLSVTYNSASLCGTDTTTGLFIGATPYAASVDINGNVAFINGASAVTLSGISNTGYPNFCALGAYISGRTITTDVAGNIWASTSSSTAANFYTPEYTAGGAVVKWPSTDGTSTFGPYAVTADGKGNLFYSVVATGSLQEFTQAAFAPAPTNSALVGTAVGAATNLYYLAADSAGNIVAPTASGAIFQDWALQTAGTGYIRTTLTITGAATPYGAAIDASGAIYGGNTCCSATAANEVYKNALTYTTTGTTTTVATGTATKSPVKNYAGVDGVRSVALDGAGNVWAGNYYTAFGSASATTALGTGVWAVAETDANFNSLSADPTAGFSCASTTQYTCPDYAGFIKTGLGASRGLIVDQSGNVWVPSDLTLNNGTGTGASTAPGAIVEIIGAAVPTVQPLSIAARDGKLATKP